MTDPVCVRAPRSKKARQLMREMFETLEPTVERDRRNMSVVDSCLADYRGEPR